jgi:hypothetical protein
MNRALVATAALALAGALALALTGTLDAVHALLLAAVVVVTFAAWRTFDGGHEEKWPDLPEERRAGARQDVSELGWATFTRDGTVSPRVVRRVRALAVARLAALSVDADDDSQRGEVERLLGREVVAGLANPTAPTARHLTTWLDAIERLAPDDGRQHR